MQIAAPTDWVSFRRTARSLIAMQASPESILWGEAGLQQSLLTETCDLVETSNQFSVPRSYIQVAERVAIHSDGSRWASLYTALWRIVQGERSLMEIAADPLVARLNNMAKSVKRDMHKMTAFVRFRCVQMDGDEYYVAWYEPDHFIVEATAPFFARRFPSMRWSILTPHACVHHVDGQLQFTAGVTRDDAPRDDGVETLWLSYYRNIFNPARIKLKAMRNEMPTRFWSNLPEAALITDMLREAPARVEAMLAQAEALSAPSSGPVPRRHTPIVQAHDASHQRATPPRVRIGVAGWDYPDWSGVVYPNDRSFDRLRGVAGIVDIIEVNSTFYRPISAAAVRSWTERTRDFAALRFSAKLWRRFTHDDTPWGIHDVRQVRAGFDAMRDAGFLDSIVVQFPWSFRHDDANLSRMERIAADLEGLPLHFETRHESWIEGGVEQWLRDRDLGFVNVDQPQLRDCIAPTSIATTPTAYVRLHGRNEQTWFDPDAGRDARYNYSYANSELAGWAHRVREMEHTPGVAGVDVIFNNHYRGQAVNNAVEFARILRGQPAAAAAGADARGYGVERASALR